MLGAHMNIIQIFFVFCTADLAEGSFDDQFRKADNRVKWCAQLVAHIREECRFCTVCGVRLLFRLPQGFFHLFPDGDVHDGGDKEFTVLA